MAWGFADGNKLNLYQTTTMALNTGDGSTNQFQNASGTAVSINNYKNAWHHFCITGDGTESKLYINGSYMGTALTYVSLTGTELWLSGWNRTPLYTFSGCQLCDFRIYATALSAEDILSLYKKSMIISGSTVKSRSLE